MPAHHDPHPPLWRRVFFSLPQTRLGWWAIGLAAPALLQPVFFRVFDLLGWQFHRPPIAWEYGTSDEYPLVGFTWLLFAVASGAVSMIAVARDRSALVWLAMVPGLMFFAYFVWAISSMTIQQDANPWVTAPLAFVLWLVMLAKRLNVDRRDRQRRDGG